MMRSLTLRILAAVSLALSWAAGVVLRAGGGVAPARLLCRGAHAIDGATHRVGGGR